MTKDSFHRDILDRLDEPIDPEQFEACMADLLREIWPGLAPIPGGADGGMDGAVADGQGQPFPLVTTTADNVIGNLTKNLQSYLQTGGNRRRIILATSEALTAERRRNLDKRADELGFTIEQIYERSAVSNLLYQSPEWCQRLLRLSGDPSPLSSIPKTRRPLVDQSLVGREEDIDWLENTEGDRLLVGQPGSGKTFLLYQLVEAGALFVTSHDRSDIADALRKLSPEALIVDDASSKTDLLDDLRHLRGETAATFDIIASCWPGDVGEVQQILQLGSVQTHVLRPLTRDQIVEIVRDAGIAGPLDLIRMIVNQANGRPGLAVTLSHLCLHGNEKDVVFGDHVAENTLVTFRPVVGEDAKDLLALISIGGEGGLPMQAVADLLEKPLTQVRQALEQLAVGGVLTDWTTNDRKEKGGLSVQPPALRHALIREVFFEGAAPLPFSVLEDTLNRARSLSDATQALIGASARGASIPTGFLRKLISELDDQDLWHAYASVGPKESRWVLSERPRRVLQFAGTVLRHAPKESLPLLLQQSKGDDRALHSTPNHPLRKIKDWVLSGRPGTEDALQRRRILFQVVEDWIKEGRNRRTGQRAIRYALAPQYDAHFSDPGSGRTLTMERGVLLPSEISALEELWKQFWGKLSPENIEEWPPLLDLLHDWYHPNLHWEEIPEEHWQKIRDCGERQVRIAVREASEYPGVLRKLSQKAEQAGVEIETSKFEAFDALYPEQHPEDWSAARRKQMELIEEVADTWSQDSPDEIADQVRDVWKQTAVTGLNMNNTLELCRDLASSVPNPLNCHKAFVDVDLPPRFAHPFLRHAVKEGHDNWEKHVRRHIQEESEYFRSALQIALSTPEAGEDLRDLAVRRAGGEGLVKQMIIRGQLSLAVIEDLLEHGNDRVASATAEALWRAERLDSAEICGIPISLRDQWRHVAARRTGDAAWLKNAFQHDEELAFQWTAHHIQETSLADLFNFSVHGTEEAATQYLSLDQRRELIDRICSLGEERRVYTGGWTQLLVGDNIDLYKHLLEQNLEIDVALGPLRGKPDDSWVVKAFIALKNGYTAQEIAEAAFHGLSFTHAGPLSNYWREWIEAFRDRSVDSPELQKALEHGAHVAEQKVEQAKEREYREKL
jgi:hypothetical protein